MLNRAIDGKRARSECYEVVLIMTFKGECPKETWINCFKQFSNSSYRFNPVITWSLPNLVSTINISRNRLDVGLFLRFKTWIIRYNNGSDLDLAQLSSNHCWFWVKLIYLNISRSNCGSSFLSIKNRSINAALCVGYFVTLCVRSFVVTYVMYFSFNKIFLFIKKKKKKKDQSIKIDNRSNISISRWSITKLIQFMTIEVIEFKKKITTKIEMNALNISQINYTHHTNPWGAKCATQARQCSLYVHVY